MCSPSELSGIGFLATGSSSSAASRQALSDHMAKTLRRELQLLVSPVKLLDGDA
jgi:hypothetical protein